MLAFSLMSNHSYCSGDMGSKENWEYLKSRASFFFTVDADVGAVHEVLNTKPTQH